MVLNIRSVTKGWHRALEG